MYQITLISYVPFLAMTSSRVLVFWWGHLLSLHHGYSDTFKRLIKTLSRADVIIANIENLPIGGQMLQCVTSIKK